MPTYNNAHSLESVLSKLLEYTDRILVVNDGSTDRTTEILAVFSEIETVSYSKNQGKGHALKKGFERAAELGFAHALTFDSDGQHFAADLPVFLERLEQQQAKSAEVLLIGSRKMDDASVPKKSSFGNKFSNFWFWVETGLKLSDTQCGFRLYPLRAVNQIPLFSKRFEFEIEVIVKAAWRGVSVENIPVKVHYDENRVSHFRPFQDFFRISVLNTYLVVVAFFFVGPRNMLQNFKKKGLKRFWNEDVLKSNEPPLQKSKAVALGVFLGIAPFWGFQTILVLLTARLLHLNKLIAFLFSNISLPPFIPFIVYGSYQTGALVLGKTPQWDMEVQKINNGLDILKGMGQYILGSLVLAGLLSALFGILFYFLFSMVQQNRSFK